MYKNAVSMSHTHFLVRCVARTILELKTMFDRLGPASIAFRSHRRRQLVFGRSTLRIAPAAAKLRLWLITPRRTVGQQNNSHRRPSSFARTTTQNYDATQSCVLHSFRTIRFKRARVQRSQSSAASSDTNCLCPTNSDHEPASPHPRPRTATRLITFSVCL